MKVLQSGRQIERRLIIIRRTCRPLRQPFYFGRFGQIFWRILFPYSR